MQPVIAAPSVTSSNKCKDEIATESYRTLVQQDGTQAQCPVHYHPSIKYILCVMAYYIQA